MVKYHQGIVKLYRVNVLKDFFHLLQKIETMKVTLSLSDIVALITGIQNKNGVGVISCR